MYIINPDMCVGCELCKENCSAEAIVLWFDIELNWLKANLITSVITLCD